MAEPAFGVYVHWPFCASKCPYCDFNSHVRAGGIDEPRFLRAYLTELAHWAALTPGRTVGSIFFGGGTPSLMAPATVAAICNAIAGHWRLLPGVEVTLEANPSSVEAERFSGYRSAGVNRVSLGVQSLIDEDLRALGRLHTAEEARAAIDIAARTFDRFSFDLIYARPRQTLAAWQAELAEALTLAARHLSLYQLTIEPQTPFADLHARGRLVIPDAELAHDFYALTGEMTQAAGLPAYEVSNHAAPGEECRHNLLYWRYGEYAGIGAGAHGRYVRDGVRHATATGRRPERWAELVEARGHGIDELTALTHEETADEALIMGLRLAEGLDLGRLAATSGLAPDRRAVDKLIGEGLLERCGASRIRATAAGRMVVNRIVLQLASALAPVPAAVS
ncbi:MAG TPA: radical SAM family heme chaperone HemW [Hyphomicrobiaceae bacterium]|nr:radical SAM family heme chaperone HemW [Hyphomicrobiaceae bacterium]